MRKIKLLKGNSRPASDQFWPMSEITGRGVGSWGILLTIPAPQCYAVGWFSGRRLILGITVQVGWEQPGATVVVDNEEYGLYWPREE